MHSNIRLVSKRTVADQPDSVLSAQWIITKRTVGIVVTVLEPLQIWLDNTLKDNQRKKLLTVMIYKIHFTFYQHINLNILAYPCWLTEKDTMYKWCFLNLFKCTSRPRSTEKNEKSSLTADFRSVMQTVLPNYAFSIRQKTIILGWFCLVGRFEIY